MRTIVILTRRADADAEHLARLSKPELLAVWQGMAEGTVRAAHGLLEGAGAVLELETRTLEEAKYYVTSLPYVEEDLLDVQYCPLQPFPAFHALAAAAAA
ncbi:MULTISPECIES: hypothetical protein [unclassified Variovorax]|uniref:hypothetical protein n=1 Tax=unclassified Variovorax TaxID=663243 RepID=UPI00076C0DE5|nr:MULTISPECIES: hypothetical protein [unclassified Variovorax]KWT98586.1 hypothetical protein APY03_0333 [Variovorax sp. WDL1]PNG46732.1 hypothetical protein CHC06_07075 [Variovorax sp. B2]PNG48617.1 hypothetical protein CHC07_07793 [Variovorax sp. B4]VTV14525.1 hypothetical protein WDL1CHR_05048 [Variovorax sp. WDL1]